MKKILLVILLMGINLSYIMSQKTITLKMNNQENSLFSVFRSDDNKATLFVIDNKLLRKNDTLLIENSATKYDSILCEGNLISVWAKSEGGWLISNHFLFEEGRWRWISVKRLPPVFPFVGDIVENKYYNHWDYYSYKTDVIMARLTIYIGGVGGGELVKVEKLNVELKLNTKSGEFEEVKRTKIE